jgi:sugar lactone lactonase YvrE
VDPGSTQELSFPVQASLLLDDPFDRSEGITFNGEGELFVAANAAAWHVDASGHPTKLTDLYSNLGMAAMGDRDFLVADFGPTNGFTHGPNDDGIVWRVTPEGEKTALARGIGDPNAILMRPDGSFLVSDDATDKIYLVDRGGTVTVFSDAIDYPNGLAFSLDGRTLYVAQIFQSIDPIVPDDRVWALPLGEDGMPNGPPTVLGRVGEGEAPDGLVVDELGRVYVAANGGGRVYRFDPESGERVLIADNIPSIASLVFGQGAFDPHTLYGTSTFAGGGKVWVIPVGVGGGPVFR